MKKIYLILLVILLSCNKSPLDPIDEPEEDLPTSVLSACPDKRLIGVWWYRTYGTYYEVIGDWDHRTAIAYTFEDNNRCSWFYTKYDYGIVPYDYPKFYNYEWKKSGDTVSLRLWDNEFSSWRTTIIKYINTTNITVDGDNFYK